MWQWVARVSGVVEGKPRYAASADMSSSQTTLSHFFNSLPSSLIISVHFIEGAHSISKSVITVFPHNFIVRMHIYSLSKNLCSQFPTLISFSLPPPNPSHLSISSTPHPAECTKGGRMTCQVHSLRELTQTFNPTRTNRDAKGDRKCERKAKVTNSRKC